MCQRLTAGIFDAQYHFTANLEKKITNKSDIAAIGTQDRVSGSITIDDKAVQNSARREIGNVACLSSRRWCNRRWLHTRRCLRQKNGDYAKVGQESILRWFDD